jgi:hypothetical protein
MKFSLFFLPRTKNNKASTSEITATKQAKQLLQLVFFLGGGWGGIETDLKRGPSSCPLGSLMDRNAEFSKNQKMVVLEGSEKPILEEGNNEALVGILCVCAL